MSPESSIHKVRQLPQDLGASLESYAEEARVMRVLSMQGCMQLGTWAMQGQLLRARATKRWSPGESLAHFLF